jgi:uncharacterized membrane protein YjjP (DUF1212 family)
MEDAPTHAPDEPLTNDRSNQCAPPAPSSSSPQGARPVLATHLQPDNKKSSRTNSNFSISSLIKRPRRQSVITKNVEGVLHVACIILFLTSRRIEITQRRKFILKLAKALLSFGAPSHRIESQLSAASNILDAQAGQYYLPLIINTVHNLKYITTSEFVHLPNIIIVSIRNDETRATRTYFVRSRGRIALTSLQKVHEIYRDVLHDVIGAEAGTEALRKLLRSPPIYSLKLRCFLAFVCASIICGLSFGGSILDVWVSGACASVLQYLGLNAANKSSMYANVYE